MLSGGFIFGLNCGGDQQSPQLQPDVISRAQPYTPPQASQRTTPLQVQPAAPEPYSVKLFSVVGDGFLSAIPRGDGIDPVLTKYFEDRSFNYFKAMNDFGYVVDVTDRYINDANIPSSDKNKFKGYKDAFAILFGGFSMIYPYMGESQEFAGLNLFNAMKMLVANSETFESPWKMLYEYSRQDTVSRPGDERWMMDMLYADSMLQSMLNYAQSKLDEALTKIQNNEWTVKKQGGVVYLCQSSTWNNNAKINAEEYFSTIIWEGTQKDARLAEARQVVEGARAECSACVPSEAFVAAIDPNIMENWMNAEVPEPDIPEMVVYHLLQMEGGFAGKAASQLLSGMPTSTLRLPPPPDCTPGECLEWGRAPTPNEIMQGAVRECIKRCE